MLRMQQQQAEYTCSNRKESNTPACYNHKPEPKRSLQALPEHAQNGQSNHMTAQLQKYPMKRPLNHGTASASSSSSSRSNPSSESSSGRAAASSAGGAASVRPASALRVLASISLSTMLCLECNVYGN